MIELFHELAIASGISRMNISIQAISKSNVAVVIQAVLESAPENLSQEQQSLREALASPIIVKGLAGEVEARLDALLSDYVSSIKPLADSLEVQVEKNISKTESAAKSATASTNNTSGGDDTSDGSSLIENSDETDLSSSHATSI